LFRIQKISLNKFISIMDLSGIAADKPDGLIVSVEFLSNSVCDSAIGTEYGMHGDS
jgi:hypothetical protein